MSRLSAFLKNFDTANKVRIFGNNNTLLFEGAAGSVPQELADSTEVEKGTAKGTGEYLEVKVKKS